MRPDQGFGPGGGQLRQGHVHTLRPGGPGRDLIGLEFDAQPLRRQGQISEIAQLRGHAVADHVFIRIFTQRAGKLFP